MFDWFSSSRGTRHYSIPLTEGNTIRRPLTANYYWGHKGKDGVLLFYKSKFLGSTLHFRSQQRIDSLNKSVLKRIKKGKQPPTEAEVYPFTRIITIGQKRDPYIEEIKEIEREHKFEQAQAAAGIPRMFAEFETENYITAEARHQEWSKQAVKAHQENIKNYRSHPTLSKQVIEALRKRKTEQDLTPDKPVSEPAAELSQTELDELLTINQQLDFEL